VDVQDGGKNIGVRRTFAQLEHISVDFVRYQLHRTQLLLLAGTPHRQEPPVLPINPINQSTNQPVNQ
jgi:hypothetical protein